MSVADVAAISGAAAGAVVVLGAAVAVTHRIRIRARRFGEFLDDWNGEPERKGVAARLGVMQRLKELDEGNLHIISRVTDVEEAQRATAQRLRAIEKEMYPNGGDSMRDVVNVIRDQVTGGSP